MVSKDNSFSQQWAAIEPEYYGVRSINVIYNLSFICFFFLLFLAQSLLLDNYTTPLYNPNQMWFANVLP